VDSIELVGDRPSSHSVLFLPVHKLERNGTTVVNSLRCMWFGVDCHGHYASWCLKAPATDCQDYSTVLFHFIDVTYIFVVFMPMNLIPPGDLSESGHAHIGHNSE
jgi:hypothetical protein